MEYGIDELIAYEMNGEGSAPYKYRVAALEEIQAGNMEAAICLSNLAVSYQLEQMYEYGLGPVHGINAESEARQESRRMMNHYERLTKQRLEEHFTRLMTIAPLEEQWLREMRCG